MNPMDVLFRGLRDAMYAVGVGSGKLVFNIPGMESIITGLDRQLSDIASAKTGAAMSLAAVPTARSSTKVPGLNLASNWLVGTAVAGAGGQVSFQENLDELEKLITYMRDQLVAVKVAYVESDTAARESLDAATARTFNDERAQPDEYGEYATLGSTQVR